MRNGSIESGSISLSASGGLFDGTASGLHVLARAFNGIAAGYAERNGPIATIPAIFFSTSFSLCSLALSGRTHSTLSKEASDVDEASCNRCRRRHCGAHQMRTAARTLTALEIAIRCRRAALAGLEAIIVHRQAH